MLTSYKVVEYFGHEPKGGDIGLEIEVEGRNLPTDVREWAATNDPSLRGTSVEYVLRGPCSVLAMKDSVNHLVEAFKKRESVLHRSVRTGVHCHINVQQLLFEELVSFIGLYLVFENVIMKACGPNRIGNYFCLRAKDTDYHLIRMAEAFRTGDFRRINDDLRYSAINFKSLLTFGSIEFRGESTPRISGMGKIIAWASMLLGLRDFAKKFDANMLYSYMKAEFDKNDSGNFLGRFLGFYAAEVLRCYPKSSELSEDISLGLETAQEWTNLAIPIRRGQNPFIKNGVGSLFGGGVKMDPVLVELDIPAGWEIQAPHVQGINGGH